MGGVALGIPSGRQGGVLPQSGGRGSAERPPLPTVPHQEGEKADLCVLTHISLEQAAARLY